MVRFVATLSGPLAVLANAAAVFVDAANCTSHASSLEGDILRLTGCAESDETVQAGQTTAQSIPGVSVGFSATALSDEEAQAEQEQALIERDLAFAAAMSLPGSGADPALSFGEAADDADAVVPSEPEAPPLTVPDLGETEAYTIRLSGLDAAELVEQGHLVCAALSGVANFAEPPTAWAKDGAWCILVVSPLQAKELRERVVDAAGVVAKVKVEKGLP